MKRLGPDVWDDENEEPIRKIGDQTLIEDEKLNELQRMVDEANRQFKTNVGDYTGRQLTSEDAWNRALAQEDMDYKRQYAEAMRNADREMENIPLMAEYNATQRYLDKELGRDPVKRVIMNDRARLGSKVRDLIPEGGMTSSANMSRELDPYQKLIAQKQSLMQPKSTPNVSIQGEGFSEGTNEALRNAVLSTLLAGGAGVAGYGSYKAGSEFAEGFKRGFNRSYESPIQTIKADELLDYNPSNRINVNPSVIEAKTSTPLLTQSTPRNARDFSYLNPKAQSIVESPYYKQGLPPVIENNPTNVFNSKSLGVNDNIDFWNNKTDDVVGHSPIDTSNLKERVNAAMKNDRFNQSFDETKNYRNYVKTLAGNTEGNPTVDMFYQGSPLSQTEVAGDVLGKLKPKQFKYNVIDDDDMFDKISDLRRNKPLNVKLKDTGFVEGDYDIPVYENASYNKNYNSKLNMGPGGKTELGEYLNFKGFPKTPSEFVPNLPKGEIIGQIPGQENRYSVLRKFLKNRAGGLGGTALKGIGPAAIVASGVGAAKDYYDASQDPNITFTEKLLRLINAAFPSEYVTKQIEAEKAARDRLSM